MREGLYCTKDDVAKKYSYYMPSCSWSASSRYVEDKRDVRRYLLEDSVHLRWTGFLIVSAKSGRMDILSRFRISDLNMDNLDSCCATKPDGLRVYNYVSSSPKLRINTIYDDMPLKGLWPWPKTPDPDEDVTPYEYDEKDNLSKESGKESFKESHESDDIYDMNQAAALFAISQDLCQNQIFL